LVLASFAILAAAPPIALAAEPPPGESSGPALPTPPPGDVVAPTSSAEAASTPLTLPPPPPPEVQEKPRFDPKVAAGAWIRIGYRVENPTDVDKLNKVFMDTIYLVAALRGEFTPWLKWQASLAAQHYTQPGDVSRDAELVIPQAGLQDAIIKIEPIEYFNVWAGKMILPIDRANLSGPWFIDSWMMRGVFPRSGATVPVPYGIKSGPYGREQGLTVWGQAGGGRLKYYAGAYELDIQSQNGHPMYSGRVSADFLDPEPGYYNQSAYHGDKDIVSIGAGAQYQKGGSVLVVPAPMANLEIGDLKIFTVDALVDKKLGPHVVTLEGNYYHTDDFQPVTRMYVVGAGYTSPPVGPGKLAPALRFQRGAVTPPIYDPVAMTGLRETGLDREFTQIDGYVQYLIKSHFAKLVVGGFWNKTRLKSTGETAYAKGIQFGLQVIAL
jgi:hypothetical protein